MVEPNAVKLARERRERLDPKLDGNRNYRSNQTSVFSSASTLSDAIIKKSAPPPKRKIGNDDPSRLRSTDVYYREGGEQQPGRRAIVRPVPAIVPVSVVTVPGELTAAVDSAVDRVQAGETRVAVRIAKGNTKLMQRARTLLDSYVTRQRITEEQGRDVILVYADADSTAPSPAPAPAAPASTLWTPPQAAALAEAVPDLSPIAPEVQQAMDDALTAVAELGKSEAAALETTVADTQENPSPFIGPEDSAPAEVESPEATLIPEINSGETAEEAPKRPTTRGRRSGRGAES